MCGFVGIFNKEGVGQERVVLEKMLNPIAHRGPDGHGIWLGEGVALGHHRLSILDLSDRAHQPILGARERSVLVYNGEVYNYKQLRSELEEEGSTFSSTGDTEVVLKALEKWGPEKALPKFDGMFALAYFDREEGSLWLARDRLGIKPLYVASCGAETLFGSEPRAILAHPRMRRQVDRLGLASFVLRGRPDPRITLYEGILALEPGSWLKIDRSGETRCTWFHVLDALEPRRIIEADPREAVRLLDRGLDESVRIHLASEVPLATICSGGVDSSLITALAKRAQDHVTAYVADVGPRRGEGQKAQRVADWLGVSLKRVPICREAFLRAWPEAVRAGGPCFHRSDVALLILVRACHADGIKVLLNGEGADELYGGYLWQEAEFRKYDWRSRVLLALNPVPRWRHQARRHLQDIQFNPLPGLGTPGFRAIATIDGEGEIRRRRLEEKLAPVTPMADRAFLVRCLDDLYYSLDTLLRRHDRMAMASSVEMRVPFLENTLIDLGIHLPRRAKYRRGHPKWVLKQVARRYLPADIVFAKKMAFPIPQEFDDGTQVLLNKGAAAELLHWSTPVRKALIEECGRDARLRFLLVGVELWAEIMFLNETPERMAEELLGSIGSRVSAR